MLNRLGKGVLVIILTAGVLLGAYLGYTRYLIELQDRTVELCVDLNDLKSMAGFEKKPLGPILDEIKKRGVTSLGVLEETLPDASAWGELYYAKGSGILRLGKFNLTFYKLAKKGLIKSNRTYVYAPSSQVRKRVYDQLSWAIGKKNLKFMGKEILEINAPEEEIRNIGLGISEAQKKFILKKGFRIIPRVWNDPHYHSGNIDPKISALKDFDLIIFDGEEIFGYPDSIKALAAGLKKYKIKYGYVEIIKQYGNRLLAKLMDRDVIRVHSVSRDELKKITKDVAIKRFVRAARERKVRLIYIRPFLPPQAGESPVAYNLDYLSKVQAELLSAGFVLGKAEKIQPLQVNGWQLLLLGLGVVIGALFLLNHFLRTNVILMYLILILGAAGMVFGGLNGYKTELQQGLALLAAITFPSLAVISSFARKGKSHFLLGEAVFIVLNIVAETMIGVFLVIGLLADYRFMLGVETFRGVKLALIAPILLVAIYFILKQGEGGIKDRIFSFLNTQVKMLAILLGIFVLGALGLFVARSGNFVLPIPGLEKYLRTFLETILFVRPRFKEFLVGYPFLFLGAVFFLRGREKWLWILASLGTIAPISIINTFSHIHTPLMVSMIRTVNGLVLGIVAGALVALGASLFLKKGEEI